MYHLASATKKHSHKIDVKGTERLLEKAKEFGIKHFVYISIVGVDQLPLKYFKIKRAAEKVVIQSGLPYTILRATQFYDFFEQEVRRYGKWPVVFVPSAIKYQPIETRIVANRLFELGLGKPNNQLVEIGGSQQIRFGQAIKAWAKHHKRINLRLPIPLE